jgi:flagellar hook-associated protein 3 FlgL
MRVTSDMMAANSLRRLSTRLATYEKTQTRLSTGRRFQVASEDVSGSVRAQSLRAGMRVREQEARNAADAKSWLDIADAQLQGAVESLQRVRELAVRGANFHAGGEGDALAAEVDALKAELLSVANFSYRGRPLFAGHAEGPAVDPGAGYTYNGDQGAIERRVGEHDLVPVNVTADVVFGFGRPDGQNLFQSLDDLSAALRAGDQDTVAALITRLDEGRDDITGALAQIGSRTNWVESALHRSESTLHAMRVELAEIQDVDIAEAIMDLQVQEVAYQATLQAVARALPPSLASFLR